MADLSLLGDYQKLGLEINSQREDIEKTYNKLNASYLDSQISFEEWLEIDLAYTNITSYLDGLDEFKAKERFIKKKIYLLESERMRRMTKMVREEEERKGPFWIWLEDVNISEIEESGLDLLGYMAESVEQVLESDYANAYKTFSKRLKAMWDEIYLGICKYEYDLLVQGYYDMPCSFSVGMDELTIPRFPKGKYRDVFDMGKVLSSIIPESETHYVINRHLALLSESVGLEFKVTSYGECPIYSFSPNTRLKKYKEEYLEQFGEEVRSGKRKSPYVDGDELISYVTKALKPFNSYIK